LAESQEIPEKMKKKFHVSKKDINGCCYYVMEPLNSGKTKHILYLHGGGYVYEITSLQWNFLQKLAEASHCTITIPIYPLAPEHKCEEVFDMLIPLYKQIISKVKPEEVVVIGDSSGGGMSLALVQLLRENQIPQPGNVILISPALDMTLTNPEIPAVEKIDPILAQPSFLEFGSWAGGEKGPAHYILSPIFGNLESLGKVSLFIGTHDLLFPDAKRFKKIVDEKGISINYFEYSSMIHNWPMLPFPESKKARKQIIDIIMSS
jgi:acetyl esterase/lipase